MTYTNYDEYGGEIAVYHRLGDSFCDIKINNKTTFHLDKDCLEEFIGVLLHVQAKIRKEAKNG